MSTNNKKQKRNRLQSVSIPTEIIFHLIIGGFAIACILPFIFVIIISFSSEESIRMIGYSFKPIKWSTDAYKFVFEMGSQLWRSYFNSFFVSVVGTLISITMCVMYAYALFRRDFKYRKFFTFFAFFTMLFGGGLAPTYMVCKQMLSLSDNYAALIVPALVNPFFIIIMRTFLQTSVPEELIEAAAIDGSGEYNTLFKIIIPISKPGIATVSLLTIINYWNDWFLAMLYVREPNLYPLQYLLMKMQNQVDFLIKNSSVIGVEASKLLQDLPSTSLRMSLVVFIVVPIACAYPFFQRYIISGLTIGSVKG
ncbi:MAG: carbohydrate ABC transporter permease [Lachnospiraceae bacterium]|nr:carbohydrate ABC transporter permease [Lachnospiraceae bacterium]